MRGFERLAAGLLTLLAVGVHALRLTAAGALWRDEAATAALATLPSLRDVFRLLPYDSFPLAVPLTLRLYMRAAGQGDLALRVFGFLVGLGIVAALWLAARAAGRTLPLLALALLAGNAAFVVFGDAVRGYGLGCLCLLLAFAALARLLARPGPWPAAAALVAALGAVHCVIANAALLAAMGAAALAAALAGGLRRVALWVAGIGLAAGLSLLVYAAPFAEQRSWSAVLIYPTSLEHIGQVLWATLGPWPLRWAWLGLALAAIGAVGAAGAVGGDEDEVAARLRRFCALTLVLAVGAQLVFLRVLSYTPRAWYDLSLLALAAVAMEPLLAGLCGSLRRRAVRAALALALAAAALPAGLPHLRARMTNADLVARRVEEEAAGGDLVVVTPWNFGISWNRVYHGAARWMTLPELADHRLHRYDLVKARLAAPGAIDDVLAAVHRTLAGGHRVWLVGQPRFPPPGHPAPVLPPAPATPWGWHDLPYMESWALRLGALVRAEAARVERVNVAPAGQPVSPLEDMVLAVASGARLGGAAAF